MIPPANVRPSGRVFDGRTWWLLIGLRQLLIAGLGLLEDYMELERSIVPRRKRSIAN